MTNDGKPYGPWKYKQLVRECYLISKNSNLTYEEALRRTPTERQYIMEEIQREFEKTEQELEAAKKNRKK